MCITSFDIHTHPFLPTGLPAALHTCRHPAVRTATRVRFVGCAIPRRAHQTRRPARRPPYAKRLSTACEPSELRRATAEAIWSVVPDMAVALADTGEGAILPRWVSELGGASVDLNEHIRPATGACSAEITVPLSTQGADLSRSWQLVSRHRWERGTSCRLVNVHLASRRCR